MSPLKQQFKHLFFVHSPITCLIASKIVSELPEDQQVLVVTTRGQKIKFKHDICYSFKDEEVLHDFHKFLELLHFDLELKNKHMAMIFKKGG